MDAGVGSKIFFYFLLLIGAAYFSGAESAYARASRIKLKSAADEGNSKARRALVIVNDFESALSAILVGTNIMHSACSALATLIVVELWGDRFTVVGTAVTTVIVFLFCEMLPKSYATAHSERIAQRYSASLSFIIKLLKPVTFVFGKIGDLFSKLFGGGENGQITEEELETIIDNVSESGDLDEEQTDLLQNAVDFTKTPVEDVMTMREDIVGVDVNLPQNEVLDVIKKTGFSRLLVYKGDIDHVMGILPVREYLRRYVKYGSVNIRRLLYEPKYTYPDAPIDDLFSEMSRGKKQLVVVRENSKTVGIATIEDFLEELVGEMWDEYDVYDKNFIKLGGNFFEISPKMKVREAFLRMKSELPSPAVQRMSMESWLRSNVKEPLEEDDAFVYRRAVIRAGETEDGKLQSVIVHLCDDEAEAKEEVENA